MISPALVGPLIAASCGELVQHDKKLTSTLSLRHQRQRQCGKLSHDERAHPCSWLMLTRLCSYRCVFARVGALHPLTSLKVSHRYPSFTYQSNVTCVIPRLECHSRRPGSILEKGPLEERTVCWRRSRNVCLTQYSPEHGYKDIGPMHCTFSQTQIHMSM